MRRNVDIDQCQLRALIASDQMQALMAKLPINGTPSDVDTIAKKAVQCADALLAELEKTWTQRRSS